jgi:hypothetical protein
MWWLSGEAVDWWQFGRDVVVPWGYGGSDLKLLPSQSSRVGRNNDIK